MEEQLNTRKAREMGLTQSYTLKSEGEKAEAERFCKEGMKKK